MRTMEARFGVLFRAFFWSVVPLSLGLIYYWTDLTPRKIQLPVSYSTGRILRPPLLFMYLQSCILEPDGLLEDWTAWLIIIIVVLALLDLETTIHREPD